MTWVLMNETDATARDWRASLLPTDATIERAIANLNASSLRIALMVEADDTLVGTITDGDIRRGLLRGLGLASPALDVVKTTPLVVPPGMDRELVTHLMSANAIQQIPVVDEARRVVGLHVFDDRLGSAVRPNTVVI